MAAELWGLKGDELQSIQEAIREASSASEEPEEDD
jgi:hypothetical protein